MVWGVKGKLSKRRLYLITIATECIAVHFYQNHIIENLLKDSFIYNRKYVLYLFFFFFATKVNIATFIFRTYTPQAATLQKHYIKN